MKNLNKIFVVLVFAFFSVPFFAFASVYNTATSSLSNASLILYAGTAHDPQYIISASSTIYVTALAVSECTEGASYSATPVLHNVTRAYYATGTPITIPHCAVTGATSVYPPPATLNTTFDRYAMVASGDDVRVRWTNNNNYWHATLLSYAHTNEPVQVGYVQISNPSTYGVAGTMWGVLSYVYNVPQVNSLNAFIQGGYTFLNEGGYVRFNYTRADVTDAKTRYLLVCEYTVASTTFSINASICLGDAHTYDLGTNATGTIDVVTRAPVATTNIMRGFYSPFASFFRLDGTLFAVDYVQIKYAVIGQYDNPATTTQKLATSSSPYFDVLSSYKTGQYAQGPGCTTLYGGWASDFFCVISDFFSYVFILPDGAVSDTLAKVQTDIGSVFPFSTFRILRTVYQTFDDQISTTTPLTYSELIPSEMIPAAVASTSIAYGLDSIGNGTFSNVFTSMQDIDDFFATNIFWSQNVRYTVQLFAGYSFGLYAILRAFSFLNFQFGDGWSETLETETTGYNQVDDAPRRRSIIRPTANVRRTRKRLI